MCMAMLCVSINYGDRANKWCQSLVSARIITVHPTIIIVAHWPIKNKCTHTVTITATLPGHKEMCMGMLYVSINYGDRANKWCQ